MSCRSQNEHELRITNDVRRKATSRQYRSTDQRLPVQPTYSVQHLFLSDSGTTIRFSRTNRRFSSAAHYTLVPRAHILCPEYDGAVPDFYSYKSCGLPGAGWDTPCCRILSTEKANLASATESASYACSMCMRHSCI
jgi:hypothetical protein